MYGAGAIAQRVGHLPCTQPTRVQFLYPSRRVCQATETIPPARKSLASYPWHIRYARNSNNKSHNGDVTVARSSKIDEQQDNGATVLIKYEVLCLCSQSSRTILWNGFYYYSYFLENKSDTALKLLPGFIDLAELSQTHS